MGPHDTGQSNHRVHEYRISTSVRLMLVVRFTNLKSDMVMRGTLQQLLRRREEFCS